MKVGGLNRITITLYEGDVKILKLLAEKTGVSNADAMRSAIRLLHKNLSGFKNDLKKGG